MPALANSASTLPWRCSVPAMAASICDSSPMSQRSDEAVTPRADSSATAFSLRSSLRAQMATEAPARATPLASPKPIPVLPPVTTTTLPVRSSIVPTLVAAVDVQRRKVVDHLPELLAGRGRELDRQPRHTDLAELRDLVGEQTEVGLLLIVETQAERHEADIERFGAARFLGHALRLLHAARKVVHGFEVGGAGVPTRLL